MIKFRFMAILILAAAISGCQSEGGGGSVPAPAVLDEDAIGYYDQMIVMDHAGPRAQVHLAGTASPLWFSSVRDGLAYFKSPERSAPVLVVYVSDVGRAAGWDQMGVDNWIDAATAYFVVGSDAVGGMGAPAFVPFSDEEKALVFAQERGGEVLSLSDITPEMVLAPLDSSRMTMPSMDGEPGMNQMQDMSSKGGE